MAAQDRKTSGADDVMVYNNIVVLILEDLETDHEKRKRLKEKIIVLQFTLIQEFSLTVQNLLLTWIAHCDLTSQLGISIGQSVEKDWNTIQQYLSTHHLIISM